MILNHDEILHAYHYSRIKITPFTVDRIGPNSYDVTLMPKLLRYDLATTSIVPVTSDRGDPRPRFIDPRAQNPTIELEIPEEGLVIYPNQFFLGATDEVVDNLADDLVPMLEGRSSVARLGLEVHVTAGFGDIGFAGRWTLEISCRAPIKIYPHMPIAQLFWLRTSPSRARYQGKYAGESDGPIASRLFREAR